jgi:hypothetical protein
MALCLHVLTGTAAFVLSRHAGEIIAVSISGKGGATG